MNEARGLLLQKVIKRVNARYVLNGCTIGYDIVNSAINESISTISEPIGFLSMAECEENGELEKIIE